MKFSTAAATFAVLVSGATAFTVAGTGSSAASIVGSSAQRDAVRTATSTTQLSEKMAEELGTPCEDECAMDCYPNMPPSVHPGVNTGQAMIDLLNHAKENGKSKGVAASWCSSCLVEREGDVVFVGWRSMMLRMWPPRQFICHKHASMCGEDALHMDKKARDESYGVETIAKGRTIGAWNQSSRRFGLFLSGAATSLILLLIWHHQPF